MPDTPEEKIKHKEASLFAEITRLLPDFAKSCRENKDLVIIHQDSFAADYQDDEYTLLGKAIKFAGLHGRELRIIGKNRETLEPSKKPVLLQ
jgi:hypothetical protein